MADKEDSSGMTSLQSRIRKMIKSKQENCDGEFDLPFFLGDLGMVKKKFMKWKLLMPRVDIFYAMKCCGEIPVLKMLAEMGACFDCACKNEIETVLKLGVDSSRIIFANTIKSVSCLRFASDSNVTLMTFDNEDELKKIKKYHPKTRLVIRIRCKDTEDVLCSFGLKFGCFLDDAERLLKIAQSLQLVVVGVSFHVGSGASDLTLFRSAIRDAHTVFQIGKRVGFSFDLLDIGGGFMGFDTAATSFDMVAKEVNTSLDYYFPSDTGVRIIAEPGRYLVTAAFTWVVKIIGKRSSEEREEAMNQSSNLVRSFRKSVVDKHRVCFYGTSLTNMMRDDFTCLLIDNFLTIYHGVVYEERQRRRAAPRFLYYVNDGFNGGMPKNIHILAGFKPLRQKGIDTSVTYPSVVFGPTCAPGDVVYRDISLPELYIGDWLYLENAGAYSMASASDFNMMPRAQCYYTA